MGAPIPTYGYPSRTAAVLALRETGLSDRQISERLGIGVNAVAGLRHWGEKAEKWRNARPSELQGRTVVFPRDMLERLRPHAQVRDISINELVRRVIDLVGEDGLVDGILDDADEIAAAKASADARQEEN